MCIMGSYERPTTTHQAMTTSTAPDSVLTLLALSARSFASSVACIDGFGANAATEILSEAASLIESRDLDEAHRCLSRYVGASVGCIDILRLALGDCID